MSRRLGRLRGTHSDLWGGPRRGSIGAIGHEPVTSTWIGRGGGSSTCWNIGVGTSVIEGPASTSQGADPHSSADPDRYATASVHTFIAGPCFQVFLPRTRLSTARPAPPAATTRTPDVKARPGRAAGSWNRTKVASGRPRSPRRNARRAVTPASTPHSIRSTKEPTQRGLHLFDSCFEPLEHRCAAANEPVLCPVDVVWAQENVPAPPVQGGSPTLAPPTSHAG